MTHFEVRKVYLPVLQHDELLDFLVAELEQAARQHAGPCRSVIDEEILGAYENTWRCLYDNLPVVRLRAPEEALGESICRFFVFQINPTNIDLPGKFILPLMKRGQCCR